MDGYFTIEDDISDTLTLSFSIIGYEDSEARVGLLRDKGEISISKGLFLEEVVLVGRTDERTQDIINQIETVQAKDIRKTNPQTAADALGQHAGVYIQKSQMGGGSPVIRGFEANKVLLVIDGVRMNNAIYRGGHLQNAITIDAAILDRMEVIYGPGSLIYGSDALGGVVHFRSKQPQLNLTGKSISGQAYVRYATANSEKTGHFDINYGAEKWASLTSFTISDFDDMRTGSRRTDTYPDFGTRPTYVATIGGQDSILQNDNPNVQIGTGYRQYDLLQKFIYQPSANIKFLANIQHSTSSDVPRYDALSELGDDGQLQYAEWYYGPQDRWLASARIDYSKANTFFNKMIAIAAYQRIDEDRIDRRYQSERRGVMEEDVNVYSFTADFKKDLSESWELEYGVELTANTVTSQAFEEDLVSGSRTVAEVTRYPSAGSSTSSLAAYVFSKRSFGRLDLLGGARYSDQRAKVQYLKTDVIEWPDDFYEGLNANNAAGSWSIGGLYDFGSDWKVKGQIATAFRSPNIDDLAKIRINNDEVSVPNLELGPETALTGEITLSKYAGKSFVSATIFQTNLKNAIVRENFALPDGTDVFIDEGDTLQIVSNVNAEKARVWGVSLSANYQVNEHWKFGGTTSLVKGQREDASGELSPLSHIPPMYGNMSAAYQLGSHEVQAVFRFNTEKPVEEYGDSTDNLENATPDGTPAWQTWNVYYTYQITKNLTAALSIENLLDIHYRPFSSGVSAAGRNVGVRLGMQF